MDTVELITLPDGTKAALIRSMDYGDVVIILLLLALVVLTVYREWRSAAK